MHKFFVGLIFICVVFNSAVWANDSYDRDIMNLKVYVTERKYKKAERLGEKLQKQDLTYEQRNQVAAILTSVQHVKKVKDMFKDFNQSYDDFSETYKFSPKHVLPLYFEPVVIYNGKAAMLFLRNTFYYNSRKPMKPDSLIVSIDGDKTALKDFKYEEIIISREGHYWQRKCIVSIPFTLAEKNILDGMASGKKVKMRLSSDVVKSDYSLYPFDQELLKKGTYLLLNLEGGVLKRY